MKATRVGRSPVKLPAHIATEVCECKLLPSLSIVTEFGKPPYYEAYCGKCGRIGTGLNIWGALLIWDEGHVTKLARYPKSQNPTNSHP